MKVAYATTFIFVLWLIASLYWINSQCAHSHTSYGCLSHARYMHKNIANKPRTLVNNGGKNGYIKHIFFLATSLLQAPLVDKWNGDFSREKKELL